MRLPKIAVVLAVTLAGILGFAGPARADTSGRMYTADEWNTVVGEVLWDHKALLPKCANEFAVSFIMKPGQKVLYEAELAVLEMVGYQSPVPLRRPYCTAVQVLAEGLATAKESGDVFFFRDASYKVIRPGLRANDCYVVIESGPSERDAITYKANYRMC